ncbi:hypothetical protein LUZ62_038755 [Rhynchospora pubera]|uniref:Uncharacterized protein n=1 Tax=Rhynchospora pubera TaxID=906938 RepID=A0AAV8F780_9POAL|nr:hypothetical protein LUZ62_038755 [Rhynchospora pubera]
MRSQAVQNAMRSAVVVIGAVAFSYLSFKIGFKPYLDQAQQELSRLEPAPDSSCNNDTGGCTEDCVTVVLKD